MADVIEKLLQGSAPVIVFMCVAAWLVLRAVRWCVGKTGEVLHTHVIPEYKSTKAMMQDSLDQRKTDGQRVDALLENVTTLAEVVAGNSHSVNRNGDLLMAQKDQLADVIMRIDGVPERVCQRLEERAG